MSSSPCSSATLSSEEWDEDRTSAQLELWERFMNEDSDTDLSDIEPENSMAGPSGAVKGGNLAALEVGLKPKNDLLKDVLDNSFNDLIYNILKDESAKDAGSSAKLATGTSNKEEANNSAGEKSKGVPSSGEKAPAAAKESSSNAVSKSGEGNPSASAKITAGQSLSDLEICSNCDLPRLKYPRIGLNSRPPPDLNAAYCANEPPIVLTGHDVHGNAFPGFKPKPNATNPNNAANSSAANSKPTKAKLNALKIEKKLTAEDGSSPESSDTAATPSASSTMFEYPTIKTPQMKCPNRCGQWKAVNVMAKHLDVCLLGRGRKAGREARERIGAGNSTPGDSRAGTPRPIGAGPGTKRARDPEADAEPERDRIKEKEKGGAGRLSQPKKQKRGK